MNYIDRLRTICTINSYTGNKIGVDCVGKQLDEWFGELGFEVEVHERQHIGAHRYYKSGNKDGKKLLLLGHIDTVFAPGKFDNFDADNEWVYGAGVCDMKGGIVVMLEALRGVCESSEIFNIDILLVSDEESGSDDSKALTASLASKYDYCFVYESAGEMGEVVVARKGVGTFTMEIKGKASHAGNHYSDGVDANLECSYKIQNLVALTDLSQGSTLNVGKIEGGIGANTISPSAHLLFEIRFKKIEERERLLREIETICETSYVKGSVSKLAGGLQRDVMQRDEKVDRFVRDLEQILQTDLLTQERGGVSDANTISSEGVLTIDGFGPYGDGDHTIHERALKSSFDERIQLSSVLFKHFNSRGDFSA